MTTEQPVGAVARAMAFAGGLRRNVLLAGRRWSNWPTGARDLATVVARIDTITARLQLARNAPDGSPLVAACIADLRTMLEWSTYQTGSMTTARALLFGRKTRAFAARLGLVRESVSGLAVLADSEEALIENVRMRTSYMLALAQKAPHLDLPAPAVDVAALVPKSEAKPGKLFLIQQLTKTPKGKPR